VTKGTAVSSLGQRAASVPGIAAFGGAVAVRVRSLRAGIRVTTSARASPGAERVRQRDAYGDETFCAR